MMTKEKMNISVLVDLTNKSEKVLQSAISMANLLDADITVLHIRKAIKTVIQDNQLSAVRAINDSYVNAMKKMEALIESVNSSESIKIDYEITIGNVKNEIRDHLAAKQPDIVVVGKRSTVKPSLLGDKILTFLLKKYDGMLKIVDTQKSTWDDSNLSLGYVTAGVTELTNNPVSELLMQTSQKPIRSFAVVDKTQPSQNVATSSDMIAFDFEENDVALKNISKYVAKSGVNLVCIPRDSSSSAKKGSATLNKMINRVNTSVLIA